MPIDPQKFDSLLADERARSSRQTAITAPQVSPDDMGRALSIAQRRGQPPLVVADNLPDYDERERLDAVEAAAKEQPELGTWLQKPEHAALAKDDLPALTRVAQVTPLLQTPIALPAVALSFLRQPLERGIGKAGSAHAANIGNLLQVASTAQSAGEILDMPSQSLRPIFGEGFDPLGTRRFAKEAGGVAREASAELQATSIHRPDLAQLQANPLDALSQAVAHYVQQAAQSAPSLLAAVATRNPRVGSLIIGAPSGAQTYSQLREQGVGRKEAVVAGLGSGALEVAGERLGLEALLAPWRKAIAAGPAVEFGEEFVTQIGQQNLQDQATGQRTPVLSQIADAVDAGITGATMGGAVVVTRLLGQVAKSADESVQLGEFTRAAAEAKVGKRAPAALEELVGDGTVYIPAEAVRTLYQSGDPASFVAELTGDPEAFAAAGDSGDIAIPLKKWASVIAQQPNAEEWAKHGRTQVEGYSRADLESLDMDAELAGLAANEEPETDTSGEVQQDVLAQLLAAGTYTPADAELQANVVGKVFGTLAARTGQDAKALYDRYQLRINGPEPTLGQRAMAGVKRLFQRRPVGTALANRLASDFDAVAAEYASLTGEFDSNGGQVLNTDLARELFPEYRADRTRSADVHEAASEFVKELYRRKLSQPTPQGMSPTVVLSAGGTGAGKTTGLRAIDFGAPEIIYDTNANKLESATDKIELALSAGREVKVIYIYRDPVDALRNGALPRAMRMAAEQGTGRTVPLIEHARTHVGASRVIRQLVERYKGDERVEIVAVDNSRGRNNAAVVDLDSLPEVEQNGLYENLRTALNEAKAAGEISDSVYRGFAAGDAEGLGATGRGQPKPADSHQELTPPSGGVSASGVLNQPADGGGPRGQIEIGEGRRMSIRLLTGANRSTFFHEMGHFFLEVLQDIDNPAVQSDLATIRQWVGNDGGTFTTEQHEQFARGFEAYLFEGKAPSPELVTAFARFRAWLLDVYRNMKALNVRLTDDVRGVFDRLVATEDEIEAAQVKQGMAPILTREQGRELGLTDTQWEAYAAALEAGTEEARQEVAQKLLQAHQRQQEAAYREEQAQVREEVEAEAEVAPAVRAWRILAGAQKVGGEEVPSQLRELRLDPEAILPDDREAIRGMGVTRKVGGVAPDTAAMLLGFDSGDALMQALAGVRGLQDQIDMEVARRMEGRHPDPIHELPEDAMRAVHNHKRVAAMEAELALLAKLSGQPRPNRRQLKAIAERRIAGLKVREIRPNSHLVAERKAARKATEAAAKGDFAEAIKAKREQMLHAALYSEAMRAKDRVERHARYLRRMGETKARAKLGKAGADYLEQIDGLLERFDFRQITNKAADRRASFAEWVKAQQADGRILDIPAKLLDDAFRQPWREMTVAELAELRDAVKQIAHLADLKNVLLLGSERRDRAAVDLEVAESVLEHNKARAVNGPHRSTGDEAREWLLQVRGVQGAAADLAQELDGFEEMGPVFRHVVLPVREAVLNEVNPRKEAAREHLAGLYTKHYTKKELRELWRARSIVEAGGAKWEKGQLLILALNRGNAGNVQAMLEQKQWGLTLPQIDAMLARLDERDWAFVQEVADYLDTYREEAFAATKRRTGLAPKRVEGTPFSIRGADGKVRAFPGWYFPLAYETGTGAATQTQEMNDAYESLIAGRNPLVDVTAGSQIERVGSGGRTVKFDLGVIESHLSDVIRGTYLADAIGYAHRVMHGDQFQQAITATGQTEHLKALKLWLKDAATGELVLRNHWERGMRAVRSNFTAAVLTWKATTALLQYTGIASTISEIGPQWVGHAMKVLLANPKRMRRYAMESSPMMQGRAKAIVDSVEQLHGAKAGLARALRSGNMKYGMWLIGRCQSHIDLVTWIGAEAKGLKLFGGDAVKARQYADDIVTRTQGTQEFVDKNALLRGTTSENIRQTEFVRALMALQGYMLAKGNMAYRATAKADVGSMRLNAASAQRVFKWTSQMVMLFTVDAILSSLVRGDWPDDDDDDGSTLDDWGLFIAGGTAFSALGAVPGGSSALSGMRGFDQQGVVSAAWSSAGDAINQFSQGEIDKAAIKATVTTAGFATGLPSSQINKTIDAIAAKRDGRDVNAYDYLAGPPRD